MITIYSNWFKAESLKWRPLTPVHIFIDSFIHNLPRNSILIIVEPTTIYRSVFNINIHEYLSLNANKYVAILTYDATLLSAYPNAIKYIYGTTWIKPEECESICVKYFTLTSLTGSKCFGPGHALRSDLYKRQEEYSIPYIAFRSNRDPPPIVDNNPVLGDSKLPLFDTSQFSIVIENSRQLNYFTEKLCDCLITKTIPIYYGCPNIDEYFDTRGWIILDTESADDAFEKINILTPDYYGRYVRTIDANAIAVLEYVDLYKNIDKALAMVT